MENDVCWIEDGTEESWHEEGNEGIPWRVPHSLFEISLLGSTSIIPDNELPCTHCLFCIKSTIVHMWHQSRTQAIEFHFPEPRLQLDLLADEKSSREKLTEFLCSPAVRVPCDAIAEYMAENIVIHSLTHEASIRSPSSTHHGMITYVHVALSIVVHIEFNWPDHPQFVAASKSAIHKLERVRCLEASSSTMCTVCMEDVTVGSEATRMPCLHLYHANCIEEWLEQSRFCPICRFSLPTDASDIQ